MDFDQVLYTIYHQFFLRVTNNFLILYTIQQLSSGLIQKILMKLFVVHIYLGYCPTWHPLIDEKLEFDYKAKLLRQRKAPSN